jgi:hypothetical protein
MSGTINDGGPAFPTHENVHDPRADGFHSVPGMSLRDWFAGQALAGHESLPDDRTYNEDRDGTFYEWRAKLRRDTAIYCYEMADAMLAARQGGAK